MAACALGSAQRHRAPQRRTNVSLIAIGIVTALAVGGFVTYVRLAFPWAGPARPSLRRAASWSLMGYGWSPASPGSSGSHSVTAVRTGRIFDRSPSHCCSCALGLVLAVVLGAATLV